MADVDVVGSLESVIDDDLLSRLGKSLFSLESDLPGLDELMVPWTPSSGQNAGGRPQRGRSRPPVVLSVLDVKVEAEEVLGRWAAAVASVRPEVGRAPVGGVLCARWLNRHIAVVAELSWAQMLAEEVIAVASVVADVVSPPGGEDLVPVERGTCRQMAAWARFLGRQVSKSTLYRAVASGELESEVDEENRVIVALDDVLAWCDGGGRALRGTGDVVG